MFDEEVGDLELLLDHSDHVRCEMVHGTFYVNVSRLLRLFCKIVDYPSSKIYFILTDRNVETSI